VTGKGLSDLIREEFGLRMTFVMMLLLVVVNFGNVIAEFSGIAGSMQLFHVSKYISVPICAAIVWALVVKGDYKSVEKVFLIASVFYIAYIIAGVLSRPDWHQALSETVKLPPRHVWRDKAYVYMVVGVIGTTITPWMQFYLQSSIVEKGIAVRQYKNSRWDVIVGSIFTDIVAWFIVVACAATLFTHGIRNIVDASDAAGAMKPLAGDYAFILFAAGLFNASLFAASILPLSTAYTVCEGLGFESGLDKSFKEAKFFYWFYTLLLAAGAAIVLIPNFPLVRFTILSQVLNGVLLPIVLVFMLKLINQHELMGKYTNSTWFNVIAWLTAAIVTVLSLMVMWNSIQQMKQP
jgi:Mn2+/Fe2+ NRAMP family transporter